MCREVPVEHRFSIYKIVKKRKKDWTHQWSVIDNPSAAWAAEDGEPVCTVGMGGRNEGPVALSEDPTVLNSTLSLTLAYSLMKLTVGECFKTIW